MPPNDSELASNWFRLAVEGDPSAQYELGRIFSQGKGLAQDPVKAAIWWRRAAEQGHAASQHSLGEAYNEGAGVDQDFAQAERWFLQGAKQGFPDSAYSLVEFYWAQGDQAEGLRWALLTAKNGQAKAQAFIDNFEKQAAGKSPHYIQQHDTKMAAANGDPEAQWSWALELFKGGKRNARRILVWVERAAAQGQAAAQDFVGNTHRTSNPTLAVKWWKKAAEQGNPNSQNLLGLAYATGEGIRPDDEKAILCFAAAADRGHADAQLYLEAMRSKKNLSGKAAPSTNQNHCNTARESFSYALYTLGVSYLDTQMEGTSLNRGILKKAVRLLETSSLLGDSLITKALVEAKYRLHQTEQPRKQAVSLPLQETAVIWDSWEHPGL